MAEAVALTTSIITLYNTLQRVIRFLSKFPNARGNADEIRGDCTLTQAVLGYLQQELEPNSALALLVDGHHGAVVNGTGSQDARSNLKNILRQNIEQLQLDVDAFVRELESLSRPERPDTRLGKLLESGLVAWKLPYLQAMHQRITTKRTQLEHVRNTLQLRANNPIPQRRGSEDSGISFLSGTTTLLDPGVSESSLPRTSYQDEVRFIEAVKAGNRHAVEALIQRQISLNLTHGSRKRCPLHFAAKAGNQEMVTLLLSHGAQINCFTLNRQTPLMLAISNDHADVALSLISQGADVRLRDAWGRTALHRAAGKNFYAVTQLLLNHGAEVNAYDSEGRTPLMEAICRSDRDIQPYDTNVLRLLMETNRRVLAGLGLRENGYTPLHHAAAKGYLEDLRIMMTSISSRGEETSRVLDQKQHTLIWFAAKNGYLEVVKFLVDFGVDINHPSRDEENPTALWAMVHSSISSAALPGASLLLNSGADPNVPNPSGQTLLHKACQTGNATLLTLLLQHNANPNLPDNSGLQPIHHAAKSGHLACLTHLLNFTPTPPTHIPAVNPNAPDSTSFTPVMHAAHQGHEHILHALLTHPVRPASLSPSLPTNTPDGITPLHIAISQNYLLCASYLLGRGCDINALDSRGETPLHKAARAGKEEAVMWLLRMGADKTIMSAGVVGETVGGTAAVVARVVAGTEGWGERVAGVIEGWGEESQSGEGTGRG